MENIEGFCLQNRFINMVNLTQKIPLNFLSCLVEMVDISILTAEESRMQQRSFATIGVVLLICRDFKYYIAT